MLKGQNLLFSTARLHMESRVQTAGQEMILAGGELVWRGAAVI